MVDVFRPPGGSGPGRDREEMAGTGRESVCDDILDVRDFREIGAHLDPLSSGDSDIGIEE